MSSQAVAWRRRFAERIAVAYGAHEDVVAVILGGSTAHGHADAFSDIELGVFWCRPPTQDQRRALMTGSDGRQGRFFPYDETDRTWTDDYLVLGVKIDVVHMLEHEVVAAWHRLQRAQEVALPAQQLVSVLQVAVSLHGSARIEQWRELTRSYPDALGHKMIRAHLWLTPARTRLTLLARGDVLPLYESMTAVLRRVLLMLFGLNRVYVPHGAFKWSAQFAGRFEVAPTDLARRMHLVLQGSPAEGVEQLHALVLDTYDVIDTHCPEADVEEARRWFLQPPAVWPHAPAGLGGEEP